MKKYYKGKRINKPKDVIKKENNEREYWDMMADAYIKLYDWMLEQDKKGGKNENKI